MRKFNNKKMTLYVGVVTFNTAFGKALNIKQYDIT